MSIWIPLLITVACIAIFVLLVYPGKLRAEASVIAFVALAFITFLTWIAYGVMKFYNAFWH